MAVTAVTKRDATQGKIYPFRRALWSSETLLKGLTKEIFNHLSLELRHKIHDEMWRNVVAEYDAENLSSLLRSNPEKYSDEFMAFEKIWLEDENNHYLGLRKIYSSIFNEEESSVHHRVVSRKSNFNGLEAFIDDEFALCVCFAYDELCSTRGYNEAFSLYDSFNDNAVSRWIRKAARDEWYHSLNAQWILKTIHSAEIKHTPEILRKIVNFDQERHEGYQATFLFDHDHDPENNPFDGEFLQKCANDICRFLRLSPAF